MLTKSCFNISYKYTDLMKLKTTFGIKNVFWNFWGQMSFVIQNF